MKTIKTMIKYYSLLAGILIAIVACNSKSGTMSDDSSTDGWEILFDGSSLDHWKTFGEDGLPPEWSIEGETLAFTPSNRDGEKNLVSKTNYKNFVLSLDWKISEGGNSGIFWGIQDNAKFDVPYVTGPEIQVLDNESHPDAKNGPDRMAGALYDLSPPAEQTVTHPAGEWNHVELMVNYDENKGTVKQNGELINTFPLKGEEWDAMIADSKFNGWENFAKSETGKIGLQDHGNKVWFRNIKIKEL